MNDSTATDMYVIQVRRIGGNEWFDAAAPGPYPAGKAAKVVADLNRLAECTVYRAVLVSALTNG